MNRREAIGSLAAFAISGNVRATFITSQLDRIGSEELDFHGYVVQKLSVDGCKAYIVRPRKPLQGKPWVWRAMFWDQYPGVDLALLEVGFHLAFIDVGNTFGCPDAMKHFDVFYDTLTNEYGLSRKPALEGLSRGGLYIYRWGYVCANNVGCLYGDAPVCDLKSWPGGKGKGTGDPQNWQEAIRDYHFSNEQEMMAFKGNPIDILGSIAKANVPILHVCGDADVIVPKEENTDILRMRYMSMGGPFSLIVKKGCGHHPHGLANPKPIVDFVVANCATGTIADAARKTAPQPKSITQLLPGQW